jgi:hypothetical protein
MAGSGDGDAGRLRINTIHEGSAGGVFTRVLHAQGQVIDSDDGLRPSP